MREAIHRKWHAFEGYDRKEAKEEDRKIALESNSLHFPIQSLSGSLW